MLKTIPSINNLDMNELSKKLTIEVYNNIVYDILLTKKILNLNIEIIEYIRSPIWKCLCETTKECKYQEASENEHFFLPCDREKTFILVENEYFLFEADQKIIQLITSNL